MATTNLKSGPGVPPPPAHRDDGRRHLSGRFRQQHHASTRPGNPSRLHSRASVHKITAADFEALADSVGLGGARTSGGRLSLLLNNHDDSTPCSAAAQPTPTIGGPSPPRTPICRGSGVHPHPGPHPRFGIGGPPPDTTPDLPAGDRGSSPSPVPIGDSRALGPSPHHCQWQDKGSL
jgi:hypothetical protein